METIGEMCGDNRFELIAKAKEELIAKTNIETSQEEMAVIDSILFRMWQMKWLPGQQSCKYANESIKQRAKELVKRILFAYKDGQSLEHMTKVAESYLTEQQEIDDVEKKLWTEKACNTFCHTGCPHKTDSFDCLNNKCDTWRIFKKMMEE